MSDSNAPREIERKFLVRQLPADLTLHPHTEIEQGYLALERDDGVQVRLRRRGEVFCLAYKRGKKAAREEREIHLSAEQFHVLWPATAGRRLTKRRYDVPAGDRVIEVDVYSGRHQGVVVAEVEFLDEATCQNYEPPAWLGAEVTGDPRYSNVLMAQD